MTTTTPLRVVIAPSLARRIDATLPDFLDRHSYINLLLSQALDNGNTMAESPTGGRSLLINKEDDRVRVREGLTPAEEHTAPVPAWEKEIPAHLFEHTDLIRDFWRGKKGSKAERAWKLLMTELTKIQEAHGHKVVAEQLELAINGRWASVTLANYERFAPKQKLPSQSYDGSTMDWEALQNAPVL